MPPPNALCLMLISTVRIGLMINTQFLFFFIHIWVLWSGLLSIVSYFAHSFSLLAVHVLAFESSALYRKHLGKPASRRANRKIKRELMWIMERFYTFDSEYGFSVLFFSRNPLFLFFITLFYWFVAICRKYYNTMLGLWIISCHSLAILWLNSNIFLTFVFAHAVEW